MLNRLVFHLTDQYRVKRINTESIQRPCRGMSFSQLIRSAFLSFKCLRQLKRFTSYRMRKNLAEGLVLSKLDYPRE